MMVMIVTLAPCIVPDAGRAHGGGALEQFVAALGLDVLGHDLVHGLGMATRRRREYAASPETRRARACENVIGSPGKPIVLRKSVYERSAE